MMEKKKSSKAPNSIETNESKKTQYKFVKPYTTWRGKGVKAHIRKPFSTDPKAIQKRIRSRYYYQTHKYIIKQRRRNKGK